MICIVSKNFAKTLDLKREFDVTNNSHPVTITTIRHWCGSGLDPGCKSH